MRLYRLEDLASDVIHQVVDRRLAPLATAQCQLRGTGEVASGEHSANRHEAANPAKSPAVSAAHGQRRAVLSHVAAAEGRSVIPRSCCPKSPVDVARLSYPRDNPGGVNARSPPARRVASSKRTSRPRKPSRKTAPVTWPVAAPATIR